MGGQFCTWVLWVPPYTRGSGVVTSKCRIFNSNTFPLEPQAARQNGPPTNAAWQPQPLTNLAATGMLAFLTYPRVFDMFRPSGGGVPRSISVRNSATNFVAHFSPATRALQGQGTYVTRDTPVWPNCVVTTKTQLEACQIYQMRTAVSLAALQANYPALSVSTVVPINSGIPGGMQWSYTFDARLRVESVVPSRPITRGDIGVRADSPDGFQNAFRAIMQVPVGSGTDAGHLVAASLKPPNWFFNYVPQHKKSNQGGGCWYNTEEAAKALVRLDCSLTYNVGLTYPATAPIATADSCKSSFRPTKMSLDLRIKDGTGACATMAAEWRGRSLVTYTAGTNELETTRLMAHTLHRAVFSAADNDLSGLLHFATTSAAVNQCDADTGAIYAFTSLKLTPEFTSATLLRGTHCLASGTVNVPPASVHTILTFDDADCKLWNTENTAKPDDLSDDAGFCITMVLVGNSNVLATITSVASGGCLKFIYEFDPFAAIPAPPAVHTPPASGTISTTPTTRMARPVDALLTGLIGTIDGMSGKMEECLVWNAALRGFQLTNGQAGLTHADCVRVQVSHTQ